MELLLARGEVDVLLGIFGDGRRRADVRLGCGGGAGGRYVVDGIFCVLEASESVGGTAKVT